MTQRSETQERDGAGSARHRMPIKYIGSKRQFVPLIVGVVEELAGPCTVLDLFSGTSGVGDALKRRNYRVLANDYLACGEAIARCYVEADGTAEQLRQARLLIEEFKTGTTAEVGADARVAVYEELVGRIAPLADVIADIGTNGSAAEQAAAVEFVLEGLHLNKRLNKDAAAGGAHYRG